jgi:hypothetical protein
MGIIDKNDTTMDVMAVSMFIMSWNDEYEC